MGNAFMYDDPTLKTSAVLNDAMRNAASIMGLKNQADYQQEHNRLVGQQQEYMRPYYEAMVKKIKDNEPPSTQAWDTGNLGRMTTRLKLSGVPVEKLRFINELKPLASDQNVKYGDVATAISNDWDRHRQGITEDLYNHVQGLSNKAAQMEPNDPERAKLLKDIERTTTIASKFDQIPQDKVMELFFPDIHKENMNTKMEQMKARADYAKNRFFNIPQGGTTIDTHTGKIIQGNQKYEKLDPFTEAYNGYLKEGKTPAYARMQAMKDVAQANLEGKIDTSRLYPVDDGNGNTIWVTKDEAAGMKKPKKEITEADQKKVLDTIALETKSGTQEPSAAAQTLIQNMVEPMGFDFKKVTKTVPGSIWGTNEVSTWDLVPRRKGKGTTAGADPAGTKYGTYNGRRVKQAPGKEIEYVD